MAVPSNNITGMSVNGHAVGGYRANFKGSVSAAVQLWMTAPSTVIVLHFARLFVIRILHVYLSICKGLFVM